MTLRHIVFGLAGAALLSYSLVMGLLMIGDLERWKNCRFFVRGALDDLDIRDPGDQLQLRILGILFCGFPVVVVVRILLL
jgi:hypothetical protein